MHDDPSTALRAVSPSKGICRKCGKCCYYNIEIAGVLYKSHKPCYFLDTKTNLCRVYPERFKRNPQCLTIAEAIIQRALPADCPYVADMPFYDPPEEL